MWKNTQIFQLVMHRCFWSCERLFFMRAKHITGDFEGPRIFWLLNFGVKKSLAINQFWGQRSLLQIYFFSIVQDILNFTVLTPRGWWIFHKWQIAWHKQSKRLPVVWPVWGSPESIERFITGRLRKRGNLLTGVGGVGGRGGGSRWRNLRMVRKPGPL